MSNSEKNLPTRAENRSVVTTAFSTDTPTAYSQKLQLCWLHVLSHLDHNEGKYFTPADVQVLSEHFTCFHELAADCE